MRVSRRAYMTLLGLFLIGMCQFGTSRRDLMLLLTAPWHFKCDSLVIIIGFRRVVGTMKHNIFITVHSNLEENLRLLHLGLVGSVISCRLVYHSRRLSSMLYKVEASCSLVCPWSFFNSMLFLRLLMGGSCIALSHPSFLHAVH